MWVIMNEYPSIDESIIHSNHRRRTFFLVLLFIRWCTIITTSDVWHIHFIRGSICYSREWREEKKITKEEREREKIDFILRILLSRVYTSRRRRNEVSPNSLFTLIHSNISSRIGNISTAYRQWLVTKVFRFNLIRTMKIKYWVEIFFCLFCSSYQWLPWPIITNSFVRWKFSFIYQWYYSTF